MSQVINASIDVTTLGELINKGHSAFSRSQKNQRVYCNVTIWINDDADQFGNHASIQLNSSKDGAEKDRALLPAGKKNFYIGNGKKGNLGGAHPLEQGGNPLAAVGGPAQQQPQQGFGAAWGGAPGNVLPF